MAFGREFKVGIFVLAGFSVMALVIFLIGEERHVFGSKESYYSVFDDVQGLRRGSPVRMGGVDIGTVSEVAYGKSEKDSHIYVKMSVVADEARRIRKDSEASIESKGLLGDKMIVITVGSQAQPMLPSGGEVRSKTADDITQMVNKLGAISAQAERVMSNLERTTESLADEKLQGDLKSGIAALSHILGSVERREGYVGKLVSDPNESERLSRTIAHLEQVSNNLDQTTRDVNQMLGRVQNGPGFAHDVIYGQQGSKTVEQFGNAAEELATTLKGVREGNGLARSVLFGGGPNDKLVTDLNEMSGDLRQIVSDLRAGRGTLGALLVDPSVYEDLKLVLGNVERNKALRALVRYSIKKDEVTPKVHDPDPEHGTATAPLTGPGALGDALGAGTRATSAGSE